VGAGTNERVSILLRKEVRPSETDLQAYRFTIDGRPTGAEEVAHRVSRVVVAGKVTAFRVTFSPCFPFGEMYLILTAAWPDREGSGLTDDAVWTFHLASEETTGDPNVDAAAARFECELQS
jgi:hypothetical protein